MKCRVIVLAVLVAVICSWALSASKPIPTKVPRVFSPEDEVIPGVLVIKFMPWVHVDAATGRTTHSAIERHLQEEGILSLRKALPFIPQPSLQQIAEGAVDLSRVYFAEIPHAADPRQIASRLSTVEGIEYAEPKFMSYIRDIPNDPLLPNQTSYFTLMNTFNGWTIAKGSSSVPIAVVDGGTYWQHEDLQPNMRINSPEDINHNGRYDPGPPPGGDEDGIDQDSNGFTDDVIGWNFANNTGNPRGLTSTPNSAAHGTATASHFGARTDNGIGMAGSSWNCSMIAICAASPTTDNAIAYGYEGIAYAYANGAKVINCSWGRTGGFSAFEQDVINAATQAGALVVCAAGNGLNNNGVGKSNDLQPDYPPNYKNVLAVGATSSTSDGRASFSNYGRTVPVFAPGVNIYSAFNGGGYGNGGSGTSYSSPLVAGLAGIIKSQRPALTPRQIALQIKTTCDSIDGANPSLAGNLGRGRVNFARALSESHAGIEILSADIRTPSGRTLFLQNDTILLTLTVQNILFAAASNLVFTGTSSDASVSVLQGTVNAGTLAPGQQATLAPLMFRVGTLTSSRDVALRLNWVSNTNERDSWAYKITVFPTVPQWETQASPTTTTLYSVKAVDANIAWAAGGNGTATAPVVVRTTNGGQVWTNVTGNLSNQDLYCIFALDANRAWVGTGSGKIFATTNGGASWAEQVYPGTQSPFINGIWIFPNGVGYAEGDPASSPAGRFNVLKTTNFGQSWAHLTNEPVGSSSEYGYNNSFWCTDVNRIWFGTNASRIWRTTDGGATWLSSASGATDSYAVSFKDNNNGLVAHSTGTVRLSTDGGATWNTTSSPTTSPINGLAYVSGTNFAWLASGAVPYRSTNNSASWTAQSVYPITGTLYHLSFADTSNGWAVTSGGEIIRYRPSGTTNAETNPPDVPDRFVLHQNYPNPFNPSTTISYEIAHPALVSLKVFDLLGREVATLVEDVRDAGAYTVSFDASSMSSGVYLYRLKAGAFSQTRRMILLR
jgi:photosystem II stability/assembly factor-like uncharacterized protein